MPGSREQKDPHWKDYTTIRVKKKQAKELRKLVDKKHGGQKREVFGEEVETMVRNHIELLKSKDYNPISTTGLIEE